MGTSTKTVTLTIPINFLGTVTFNGTNYANSANVLLPKGGTNTDRVWWGFDSTDLAIAEPISIDSIDFNYIVTSPASGTASFHFQLMVADNFLPQPLHGDIGGLTSGPGHFGVGEEHTGTYTTTLNSKANDDLLIFINDEFDAILNPIWYFGGAIGGSFFDYEMIMDNTRSTTINSIDVGYTITVADPPDPPAVNTISIADINIVQPSDKISTSTLLSVSPRDSRAKYTSIKIASPDTNHKETHYQIYDQNSPSGKGLILSLRSKQSIRNNGNVPRLTKNELQVFLNLRTNYRIRMRIRSTEGWGSWTVLKKFKTRKS